MADIAEIDPILAAITAWACRRTDILGLAVVGSWARGTAQTGSDIDLILLASEPQSFRHYHDWVGKITWGGAQVARWHDADYGRVWSRHVHLDPPREIEFTFCAPSWAATDPVDAGTANVVANGCHVLLDKARLLERLQAAVQARPRNDR